jgi:hypothetical protein
MSYYSFLRNQPESRRDHNEFKKSLLALLSLLPLNSMAVAIKDASVGRVLYGVTLDPNKGVLMVNKDITFGDVRR